MKPIGPAIFPTDPAAAIALQKQLAAEVQLQDDFGQVTHIAACDVGFEDDGNTTRAAVVLVNWPEMKMLDSHLARIPTRMPYIPGLLSFRELPAVLAALEKLDATPDLILVDGQGIAHPRRLGIAAHLGVVTGLPAIGVGKSRLTGQYRPPGPEKGDWSPLTDRQQTIGCVLRTRRGVKPLFVSPGHRVSLDSARQWALQTTTRYKLPEPIRMADRLASWKGGELF